MNTHWLPFSFRSLRRRPLHFIIFNTAVSFIHIHVIIRHDRRQYSFIMLHACPHGIFILNCLLFLFLFLSFSSSSFPLPSFIHLFKIDFVLMFSRQGKLRLQKWYSATNQVRPTFCPCACPVDLFQVLPVQYRSPFFLLRGERLVSSLATFSRPSSPALSASRNNHLFE